jgi:hypothetical protein
MEFFHWMFKRKQKTNSYSRPANFIKGNSKFVPVQNKAPRHEHLRASGDTDPRNLNLGTRWK